MIDFKLLNNLYVNSNQSVSEIADELNVSVSTVTWWMNKYSIKRRSRSEANYLKYNKSGDPFSISRINTKEKAFLYGMGIGLYWGEGNKVNRTSLRVGNTDTDLILMYVRFLREFCNVHESKILFGLQLFNDSNPEEAMRHWLTKLNVTRDRFMNKISIIPPQGKGTYRQKNQYGVVTVYVNNIKLVEWMHSQIDSLRKQAR